MLDPINNSSPDLNAISEVTAPASRVSQLLKSPLFWATVAFAFTVIVASALTIALDRPDYFYTKRVVPAVVGGSLMIYLTLLISHRPSRFEFTFTYTLPTLKSGWNEVAPSLVLGRLPLEGDAKRLLTEFRINHVLCLVEDFELQPRLFVPLSAAQWGGYGVGVTHIPTPDFETLHPTTLDRAVEALGALLGAGKRVLVHCKAGRGRSALVVICHLLRTGAYPDFPSAMEAVKALRPDIKLNPQQILTARAYEKKVRRDWATSSDSANISRGMQS